MKRVIFALGIVLCIHSYGQQQVVAKLKTYNFDVTNKNVTDSIHLNNALVRGQMVLYNVGKTQHLILNPNDRYYFPGYHFINKDGNWKFENMYNSLIMEGPYGYSVYDTLGNLAISSTGDEGRTVYGDLFSVKTSGDSLIANKISLDKRPYSDVSTTDANQDGLMDIVTYGGVTSSAPYDNFIRIYLQQKDGSFINKPSLMPSSAFYIGQPSIDYTVQLTGYALNSDYLYGNKYPQILRGQYSSSTPISDHRYGVAIHSYNEKSGVFDSLKLISTLGVYQDTMLGTTSIRVADLNNDGKKDFVIKYETPSGNLTGLQIFMNDGNNNFFAGQSFTFPPNKWNDGGFVLADVNQDGWIDILLSPISGTDFYINSSQVNDNTLGVKLQNSILLNNKGTFDFLKNDLSVIGPKPLYLKSNFINNQIKYVGFGFPDGNNGNPVLTAPSGAIKMYDFTVTFCNNLIKPTFNTTKYSFCSGDSLKLTVSNIYKGDTLKWYYGSKTDFTNVSSKTFTDSTKLFVTRTDSLGCVISSDTINITTYPKLQITTQLRTFKFNLSTYKDAAPNIGQKMHQAICQTVLYAVNGVEHIVTIPVDSVPNAPLHFINKKGIWELESFYPNFKMDGARNYSFIDTLGNFAYANTGSEVPKPWPLGDVVVVNTINDTLKWTKADSVKAFYHSVGTGDLNGDGLVDVVGLHMQSNYWPDNLHPFLQNKNGTYSEGKSLISSEVFAHRNSSGAVLVADLFGDSKPEIIRGTYGFTGSNGEKRYAFEILGFDKQTNQYVKVYEPKNLGVFTDIANGGQGATSIKFADFDHNGYKDLVICSEGSLPNSNTKGASMIQIWLNNGKGEFIPDQYIINNADDSLNIREFEIADVDNDGWPDIVMHGIGGISFRGKIANSNYGYFFKINNLIWKNNKGIFDIVPNQLNIFDPTNIELIGNSNFLKGFMVNGKLKFIGFEYADAQNYTKLYEISVNFCNILIKPIFNTTKFSICSGDTLKLSVTNINKGDSLKWYYGAKSDITNVSNKTFTDSTKLFVTRTDSLGCVISSDTVSLIKYAIPSAPTLSRDTTSYLLSSITKGNTWYKDGVAITDTTQKIKPTAPGSYTAKTTQNGCVSAASNAYYYIVTDVINLSTDEFIKLAPNPFTNQLNFDFVVKGYQRLNLEVFDMATGTKVASKQNLTPGLPIYLGQLSAGTYVIKVTSNDNKISYQFKMVKL